MDRRRSVRAAKLGSLVATETAKRASVRTTNVVRSKQAARSAAQARHEQFAAQLVAVLGGMRGAAMKIGQVLSILDTGLIPEQQLHPHINLYVIAREWIDGADPVTELGLMQRDWARTSRRLGR